MNNRREILQNINAVNAALAAHGASANSGNGRSGGRKRRSGDLQDPAIIAIGGGVPQKVLRMREGINEWKLNPNDEFQDKMLAAMGMLLDYTADLAHTVEDLKTRMNSMRTVAAVNLLQNNVREHCYTKFYGTVRDAFLDGNNPLRATSNYRVPTDQRQRWFNIFWEGIYLP